ncbi:DEAD/DEAH box helicase [Tepidanaerobacter sp. EBM-38]|uniref:DEAD/DEAH box helicase n=2 Tax=Tepidanaerobacter TaxID=499228 RepID=UPI000B1AD8FB|nr:DEAD/DEAH box helicase [Tepidanaerobacter sp. EBM-38]
MKYVPYYYQKYALDFILNQKAAGIFLDCGLGKTVITLTAIAELMHNRFEIARPLVIAPLRVAESIWDVEAKKWDHLKHLRIAKVLGSKEERIQALNTAADIYVINRENTKWLVDYYKNNWPFDMVVLDELSSFKSHKAQRFKALRKVRPFCKRVVGLTGTPAPNGLIDLWSQVYLLDSGKRLGKTITGYRERYFLPDKRNHNVIFTYKPKEGAEEAIYNKLSDICISMKSGDYLNIPERIDNIATVELPPKAMEQYRKLERDLLLPLLNGDVVAGSAAVLTNKLLQMTGGAVYDEDGRVQEIHDEKIKTLEDLIEAANGKPVLIYYAYCHELERIKKHLDCRVLDKPKDIEDWNKREIPVMLAHPASAGHGLNLQAGGSTIIWFGLTWSLELYQQANARIHRQGQKNMVVVHHLVARGTIDEDVMQVLKNKEAGQEALLNAVKARIYREVS